MGLILTERDREILAVLTKCVRVLSLPQIVRTWWIDSSERIALNRMRRLALEGLVEIRRELAHPELSLSSPLLSWSIGDRAPDFGALSYQLQSRWCFHPVSTTCITASAASGNQFAGFPGRRLREIERTHDIHLARIFLLYRQRSPELLNDWVFEEQIKLERARQKRSPEFLYRSDWGQKLPDVFIRNGSATRVIEFGGAYGKKKLEAFHDYCQSERFAYEIW